MILAELDIAGGCGQGDKEAPVVRVVGVESEAENAPLAAVRELVVGNVEEDRSLARFGIEAIDFAQILAENIEMVGITWADRAATAPSNPLPMRTAWTSPAPSDFLAAEAPKMMSSPARPKSSSASSVPTRTSRDLPDIHSLRTPEQHALRLDTCLDRV